MRDVWENYKYLLFIAGSTFLAFGVYNFSLDPVGATKKIRSGFAEAFDASTSGVTLPDCKTETGKTLNVNGNRYTITCAP